MRVLWTLGARDDLDRLQSYISARSPAGAKRVWTRIVERIEAQAETPFAAPVLENDRSVHDL